jgi:hypothetical protein
VLAATTWLVMGYDDLKVAEVFALYRSVKLAIDCSFRKVIFESDCENLIRILRGEKPVPGNYVGGIVSSINSLRTQYDENSFTHVHRLGNMVAHKLANLALQEHNKVWIEEIPNYIASDIVTGIIH